MSHACTPILVGVASSLSEIILSFKTAKFPMYCEALPVKKCKNSCNLNHGMPQDYFLILQALSLCVYHIITDYEVPKCRHSKLYVAWRIWTTHTTKINKQCILQINEQFVVQINEQCLLRIIYWAMYTIQICSLHGVNCWKLIIIHQC